MRITVATPVAVAIPVAVALAACGSSTGQSSAAKAPNAGVSVTPSPSNSPNTSWPSITASQAATPTPATLDPVGLLETLKVQAQTTKGTATGAERSAVGWWDNKQAILARTFRTHVGMLAALAAVKPAPHTAIITGKDWLVVLIATPYGQWANQFAPEPPAVAEDLGGSVAKVWS